MGTSKCKNFLDENYQGYLVEYRGDLLGQLENTDYACGEVITDTLGIITIKPEDIDRLQNDVPAIIFIESRGLYVLQDISPSNVDKISEVKTNPYLNLTGRGVAVAVIDSGVNYLNKEFIREDDTSRILAIWDQSIESDKENSPYIGTVYSNEEINEAIQAQLNGQDPYGIVPSKDEIGHGTEMAGIIGARGYNGEMEGIANDCDFIVVKLKESPYYKKFLRENNIPMIPVYNNTELISAIEFVRQIATKLDKPLVIYIGIGTNNGSHDGDSITSKYITALALKTSAIYVAGTGNQGNAEGHVRRFIKNVGEISEVEMVITEEMKSLNLYIWVQRPTRMSLSIISPQGEDTGFLVNQIQSNVTRNFYIINTKLVVKGFDPEALTGHQLFILDFQDIKPGIWKFRLRAEYVSNGRFDIWLPVKEVLPEGTKFLESNTENTLTIPSTARNIVSVAYYNGQTGAIVAESGRGFDTNKFIRPDISTVGTNVLTISKDGKKVIPVSGSSVATAIVAGASALLLQWGLIDRNDLSLSSNKVRSLFIYGAEREAVIKYPYEDFGYGKLDLLGIFNIFSGTYRQGNNEIENFEEDHMGDLFIRKPKLL